MINPFMKLLQGSRRALIAAPFVNKADELLKAAQAGTGISLLAGLNAATSPYVGVACAETTVILGR